MQETWTVEVQTDMLLLYGVNVPVVTSYQFTGPEAHEEAMKFAKETRRCVLKITRKYSSS